MAIVPPRQKKVKDPYAPYRDADGRITARVTFAEITRLGILLPQRKYSTAEELAVACQDYFDWAEHNPIMVAKLVSFQGSSVLEEIPKKRVLTLRALCAFININPRTWEKWRPQSPEYNHPELTPAVEWAEATIRGDKFEGAAADIYNAMIISRDLGLVDRQSHEGGATPVRTITSEMSHKEAAETYEASLHANKE